MGQGIIGDVTTAPSITYVASCDQYGSVTKSAMRCFIYRAIFKKNEKKRVCKNLARNKKSSRVGGGQSSRAFLTPYR